MKIKEDKSDKQFDLGMKTEMEHDDVIKSLIMQLNPSISKEELESLTTATRAKLVKNHTDEFDDYYTHLIKMEDTLKKNMKEAAPAGGNFSGGVTGSVSNLGQIPTAPIAAVRVGSSNIQSPEQKNPMAHGMSSRDIERIERRKKLMKDRENPYPKPIGWGLTPEQKRRIEGGGREEIAVESYARKMINLLEEDTPNKIVLDEITNMEDEGITQLTGIEPKEQINNFRKLFKDYVSNFKDELTNIEDAFWKWMDELRVQKVSDVDLRVNSEELVKKLSL